jgi:hypothetical protein
MALVELSWPSNYVGDAENALECALQAQRMGSAGIPDWTARKCGVILTATLMEARQAASAQESCAEGLAREAGDLQDQADCLWLMAELDRRTGRMADAGAHLRESLEVAARDR